VYGISKQAGEQWCAYYHKRYGVDVRSIRYPGLIGWKSAPGGGTTDYAVHIFHEALKNGTYTSFLDRGTKLPMMYMPDAIRATIDLMEAPAELVKERTSYNLAGFSFSPEDIAAEIKRTSLGSSWTMHRTTARPLPTAGRAVSTTAPPVPIGVGSPQFDLRAMVDDMMLNLKREIPRRGLVRRAGSGYRARHSCLRCNRAALFRVPRHGSPSFDSHGPHVADRPILPFAGRRMLLRAGHDRNTRYPEPGG
jgi:hypothetical protein